MTSSAVLEPDLRPRAVAAAVSDGVLRVLIRDGRELLVPVARFPWLAAADSAAQGNVSIDESGLSLWWDQVDDRLSAPRLFGLPEWP